MVSKLLALMKLDGGAFGYALTANGDSCIQLGTHGSLTAVLYGRPLSMHVYMRAPAGRVPCQCTSRFVCAHEEEGGQPVGERGRALSRQARCSPFRGCSPFRVQSLPGVATNHGCDSLLSVWRASG